MRQWKALMKKNFINWKRQAKCSFFEICCPATVMLILVYVRTFIEIAIINLENLSKVRQATYVGGVWEWNDPTADPSSSDYGQWRDFQDTVGDI